MKSYRHVCKVTLDLSELNKDDRSNLLDTLEDQKQELERIYGEVALELDFVSKERESYNYGLT
jgi:hypothetical protein|tara:strand:- start:1934 stop:2122 length:189 start_codon:yes stop_codon:yes gene_type:complete